MLMYIRPIYHIISDAKFTVMNAWNIMHAFINDILKSIFLPLLLELQSPNKSLSYVTAGRY